MRNCIALFFLAICLSASAHIGSPNVFLEDKAGDYSVRVVIRPPNVVPGLAEITVRVREPVQRVTVLPVFWKAGREGSPSPDEAKLVRGETNLFSAQLWLMKPGAYSVDVTVEGSRGKGTLVVPVNSVATNTRPMAGTHVVILSALAAILFLGAMKIVGAIFGESRLDPGAAPTAADRARGRKAMVIAAGALVLLLFGGKKWWDHDDRDYRNNMLYKPFLASAGVRVENDQPILTIDVDASSRRGRWTPLIPDHGKLMHLFLVRDGEPGAFAHLHPAQRKNTEFEAALPPLPAGKYHIYADVTHEDGFSETITAVAEIQATSLEMKRLWLESSGEAICSTTLMATLATNLFLPPDPDDSWQMDNGAIASSSQVDVGGGYKMIWEDPSSLRFKLLAPDGQPAPIEPYMGMLGHAVVWRRDGEVFAHIHPVGTFSMAAHTFFVEGKPMKSKAESSPTELGTTTQLHTSHTNRSGVPGEISFPYEFPSPGSYRFWVQMKTQGRILTGVFNTSVSAN